MGRAKRAAVGGLIYHVLNRANARLPIFEKDADYEAFERILEQAIERTGTRLLSYCLMPNHWRRKKVSGEKKGVRNRLLTFVLKFASLVGYGKSKARGSWWFDLSCA